jgi:hypothetical protein
MKTTERLFTYMTQRSEELHKTDLADKNLSNDDRFRIVIQRVNLRQNLPEIKRILND